MDKIRNTIKILREYGLKSTIAQIKDHFLRGEGAKYTKSVLGRRYHHKLYMYDRLGYWPKIRNPRTFNEKIMYRKLYTNKEIFSIIEDKWRVRQYVSDKIGSNILPELYYVTTDPETIPFDDLPNKYVIKPTHLSGGAGFIIDGTSQVNESEIKDKCVEWLNTTYGQIKEEYWYSDIEPRIIIEEYIESEGRKAPNDYKFMIFHGEVKSIHVTYDRFDDLETKRNFYDPEWNPLDVKLYFSKGNGVSKPDNLEDMIEVAEKLGEDFDHIRVDLYSPDGNRIFFGEMTVAESSGGNPFEPRCYDFELGSYW